MLYLSITPGVLIVSTETVIVATVKSQLLSSEFSLRLLLFVSGLLSVETINTNELILKS